MSKLYHNDLWLQLLFVNFYVLSGQFSISSPPLSLWFFSENRAILTAESNLEVLYMRTLFKGGTVITGRGPKRADVLVEGEKVRQVGRLILTPADRTVEAKISTQLLVNSRTVL